MSETNAVYSDRKQLVGRVTKRPGGRERTGAKVFQELERLGVSASILDCLKTAQESFPEGKRE